MNEPESSFYFTNKHQENPGDNIWYYKSPFTELVFQSYSIQTYLWLCSLGKWLPEREKSRDLYKSASIQLQRRMSFTLSRLANVLATSEFP